MTTMLTARLRLEPFADAHLDELHAMNSDPLVMRYITGRAQTLDESRAGLERVKARWAQWGYSWWSFIELASERVIGAGCIQHLGGDTANPLELGYRLRPDRWRQGFASEAARAMTAFAFETLAAPELLAVCEPANRASIAVMERLGMRYRGLERWYNCDCSVYAITRDAWHAAR